MGIKSIIVDDEKHGRENLAGLLNEYCHEIELVGEAPSVKEAIVLINRLKPDLIFLDIEMPGRNGFDLLEHFQQFDFEVIFVTAYDSYAIKAIRFSAADYILKPINYKELQNAIKKVGNILRSKNENSRLRNLLNNIQHPQNAKIGLPTFDKVEFIAVKDIIYCKSEGSYTHFYLHERQILVSKNIGEFEDILSEHSFLRVHKTYLVNMIHVAAFLKIDGGTLQMSSGVKIPISRRRKENVLFELRK
jgi:two-component system LytT family response regulator